MGQSFITGRVCVSSTFKSLMERLNELMKRAWTELRHLCIQRFAQVGSP